MSVLLSIKPKYVKEIQMGNKLYEFRKSIFKQETDEIFVYESSPTKQIVGKIYIDDIIEDTPQELTITILQESIITIFLNTSKEKKKDML